MLKACRQHDLAHDLLLLCTERDLGQAVCTARRQACCARRGVSVDVSSYVVQPKGKQLNDVLRTLMEPIHTLGLSMWEFREGIQQHMCPQSVALSDQMKLAQDATIEIFGELFGMGASKLLEASGGQCGL